MSLTKVGKSIFKFAVFFLIILTTISFFDLKKAKAQEIPCQAIVINEVMAHASIPQAKLEWVELYNNCPGPIDLNSWIFENKIINNSLAIIQPDSYLILARDPQFLTNIDPSIPVISMSMVLTDDGDMISLKNGNYFEKFTWLEDTGVNFSWEKVDSTISSDDEKSTDDNWHKSFFIGGTPGTKNSMPAFDAPVLLSPIDGEIITGTKEIEFSYEFEPGLQDKLIVSKNPDLSYPLLNIDQLDWGDYYWAVEVNSGDDKKYSDTWSFVLKDYSNAIIINEIMPDPVGDDTAGEWIELYNTSSERVNLKGWIFQDSGLSLHVILNDLYIEPLSYLLVYRSISGLTLNNSGDEIKFYQPNNVLLSSASYVNDGEEGWSWARGPTGEWSWTTTPTMTDINIISPPKVDDPVLETELVINTDPIEIPTGDFENYLDKLVKIRGKVISTSGNTFYLDDGSGIIKVYIQEKTGIDKPEMHRNDIFEIIGIVDLYGQTWRILPRVLSDIVLIEKAPVITKTTTTKKAVAKAVTVAKSPLISKAVAAASTSPPSENKDKNTTLSQLIKTSIGLAILFLVFLIFKILNQPKIKTSRQLGGHFGDDET